MTDNRQFFRWKNETWHIALSKTVNSTPKGRLLHHKRRPFIKYWKSNGYIAGMTDMFKCHPVI